MFTRILTDLERKRAKAYLKADGEKESVIRALASRARRHLPLIRSDLDLLEKLLVTYQKGKP
jgi:hypothetical protein